MSRVPLACPELVEPCLCPYALSQKSGKLSMLLHSSAGNGLCQPSICSHGTPLSEQMCCIYLERLAVQVHLLVAECSIAKHRRQCRTFCFAGHAVQNLIQTSERQVTVYLPTLLLSLTGAGCVQAKYLDGGGIVSCLEELGQIRHIEGAFQASTRLSFWRPQLF